MKRAIATIIVLIAVFSLSACSNPCANGHAWTYDVSAGTKTCSVCGTQSEYSPSGYFLDASKIEAESAMPYYNDEHIACTYTANGFVEFNENRTEENVETLIESGELFFVDAGTTCDIIEDNSYGPQQQVTLTSGKYNGTNCWTLAAVVLNDEDLEEYQEILEAPIRAAETASQIIKETGSPIKADNHFDYEKYKKLSEAFFLLYSYRENSQCAELLMSDELILNRILGSGSSVFTNSDRTQIVRFWLEEKMTNLFNSDYFYFVANANFAFKNYVTNESVFNIKNGTTLYNYNYKTQQDSDVIMEVQFLDVDTIVVTVNGETATLFRENEVVENSDSNTSTSNTNYPNYTDVSDEDDEYWYAVTAAQELVKDELKAPSTAKFSFDTSDYTVQRSGDQWKISGYVDAENGLGATLRENWTATFTMGDTSGDQYSVSNYAVTFS